MEALSGSEHRVCASKGLLGRQLAWGAGVMLAFLLLVTGMNYLYLGQIHKTCQELEENLGEQKRLNRVWCQLAACLEWEKKLPPAGRPSEERVQAADAWLAASKALLDALAERAQKVNAKVSAGVSEPPWKTWQQWAEGYVNRRLGVIENLGGTLEALESIRSSEAKKVSIPGEGESLEHLWQAVEAERNRLQAGAEVLGQRLGFLLARHRRWTAAWTVVALACVGIGLLWMGKHVLARVRVLTEAAAQLVEDKQPLALHSSSQDELAQLGAQLNRLAEKIFRPSAAPSKESSGAGRRVQWSGWIAKCADRLLEPVEKIIAANEMLLQSSRQPELLPTISSIDRNSRVVRTMVENCRLWAQLEADSLRPTPKVFTPQEMFFRLEKAVLPWTEAKRLAVQIQWEGIEKETFVSDPELLEKILFHLLSWSIETTELGAIQLQGRIDGQQKPARLQLHLVDSGQGMTPAELLLGTGALSAAKGQDSDGPPVETIGWLVCRKLVHLLGGQIEIQTIPGGGTEVKLSLPMLESAAPSANRFPLLSHTPLGAGNPAPVVQKLHGRVLLAEDGPENQRLISFILRKAGLEVDIAADGQEAVQRVLQSIKTPSTHCPYDLILMDMLMPQMDGFQATRRLRESGYRGPILAITGLTENYSTAECLQAGCTDYLAKPFEREKLLELVAKYLPTRVPAVNQTSTIPRSPACCSLAERRDSS